MEKMRPQLYLHAASLRAKGTAQHAGQRCTLAEAWRVDRDHYALRLRKLVEELAMEHANTGLDTLRIQVPRCGRWSPNHLHACSHACSSTIGRAACTFPNFRDCAWKHAMSGPNCSPACRLERRMCAAGCAG